MSGFVLCNKSFLEVAKQTVWKIHNSNDNNIFLKISIISGELFSIDSLYRLLKNFYTIIIKLSLKM